MLFPALPSIPARRLAWALLALPLAESPAPQSELLAEARAKRAEVAAGDQAGRVALAEWMIEKGLRAEAVAELNRVLEADPDQPEARALCARTALIALPAPGASDAETLAGLLTFGAKASPCGRESAVRAIARLGAGDAQRAALDAELTAGSDRRRSFAAFVLRRLYPGDSVRELLGRAVLDPSEDVRAGAALALRDASEPAVIGPILRATSSRSPAVRANAIEALGNAGYPAAVEPLIGHLAMLASPRTSSGSGTPHSNVFFGKQKAYIQDYDVEVAQSQAVADPQVNVLISGAVSDVGVHSVREYVTSERRAVRHALKKLAGADPGDQTSDWLRWWDENQDRWRARDPLARPVTPGAAARPGTPGAPARPVTSGGSR